MYISDTGNNRIRKVTASTSVITTIAGTGTAGYSGDGGAATAANIVLPHGINLDSNGNVYFGDCCGGFNVVRKITVSTGVISTVAGTGSTSGGFNGDNIQATTATLSTPHDVVLDSNGNLYICDVENFRVRKVTVSTGVITTVVGSGTASSTGDGSTATSATINRACYSRFDNSGNYYLSECAGNRIRKVTATPTAAPSLSPHSISVISTIAGTGSAGYTGDGGPATSASLYAPHGIALDSNGNVFFNDIINQCVRKITVSTGIISTYAGTGASSYSGDGGAATSAALHNPNGLYIDTSAGNPSLIPLDSLVLTGSHSLGSLLIGDQYNNRVRKVTMSTGIIATVAGVGSNGYNGDNIPATSASLYGPTGVVVDSSGNVYISDTQNNRIRKVTASTSVITTIAGTGSAGFSGDGDQATAALISYPLGINLDSVGNVYFGDFTAHNVVRKITVSTGVISTVAGTGSTSGGYNGDNMQATTATLNSPHDVVVDSNGNLYISDYSNHRVRKVDVYTGVITTVAGSGAASSTGDGSAATSAAVNGPCNSRFDGAGNLYISESDGNRVRKVVTVSTDIPTAAPSHSPHSISVISTIAGTGSAGYSGDGAVASSAAIHGPSGIAVDSNGNVYFSDIGNHSVRKITASTGIISTYAGTGSSGYSGDGGVASSAALSAPNGLSMDTAGNACIST